MERKGIGWTTCESERGKSLNTVQALSEREDGNYWREDQKHSDDEEQERKKINGYVSETNGWEREEVGSE